MLKSCLSFCIAALMGLALTDTIPAQSGAPAKEFFISTIAGIGTYGYSGDGGPALSAALGEPQGIAADSLGNLYIADTYNCVIRKITPAGIISTVSGNGHSGFSGDFGPGTNAELDRPFGVAVDAAGNLYIADSFNERIRKLDTAGTITTYAGNGTDGYSGDNGPAKNAELNFPTDVAVDSAGNLYIADFDNARIRKVTPGGTITTVAGNGVFGYSGDGGASVSAELNIPRGIATDSAGDLYIADSGNGVIRKVDTRGIITTIAGGPAGASNACPGPNVNLNFPAGIAIDSSGNLYFTDANDEVICQLAPNGTLSRAAGDGQFGHVGDGGPAILAEFQYPMSVTVDSSGNVDVADLGYIRKLTLEASPIAATPTISLASGSYSSLQYATLSDTTPNAVVHFTLDGSTPTSSSPVYQLPIYIGGSIFLKAVAIATGYTSSEVAIGEYDVTLPSATAPIFSPSPGKYVGSVAVTISATTAAAAIHYTLDGSTPLSSSPVYSGPLVLYATTTVKAITTAGGYWKSKDVAAQYVVVPYAPTPVIQPGFGYYPAGTLISISDLNPDATIRFTTDGSTPTTASRMYTAPLPLTGPMVVKAIAIATGDLTSLVAVEQYGLPGTISTFAGVLGSCPSVSGSSSRFCSPEGLSTDAAGNLYIADSTNELIRKVTPKGKITTVAGNGLAQETGDGGPAVKAGVLGPEDVAVDVAGNLYILEPFLEYLSGSEFPPGVVRKVSAASGIITTVVGGGPKGLGDGGPATDAALNTPLGITVDGAGNLYVADTLNGRVRKVNAVTGIITTIAGNGVLAEFPSTGDGGPAVDADLVFPRAVAVDYSGNLYIADFDTVRKVDQSSGIISTVAGNGHQGYSGDGGFALNAELGSIQSIACDNSGNLYIVDGENNRIRMLNIYGKIATFAGNGIAGTAGDGGPATAAELNNLYGVSVDSSDNVFISDSLDNIIRKIVQPAGP